MKDKKDVPDYLIILPITSPLRNQKDISEGIKKVISKSYDIVFSLTKSSKNPILIWLVLMEELNL